LNLKKRKKTK